MPQASFPWSGVVFIGLLAFVQWRSLIRTRRLFGCVPWRLMRQMLVFVRYTPKGILLYLCVASLFLGGWVFLRVGVPGISMWQLWLYTFVINLSVVLGMAQPPAVILLTSSSPQNAAVFRMIRIGIVPLRCVALLDYRRLGPLEMMDCFIDNLRTQNERVWKSIVHQLIEMAPVVVVDARPETGPVADEVFLMLAPDRVGRALFVIGEHGECPALKSHGVDPVECALKTATEGTLLEMLRKMLNQYQGLSNRHEITERARSPVMPEDWDHLPSVLMVSLLDAFDSQEMVRMAASSDMDLIVLVMPCVRLDERRSRRIRELSWEFAHESRLAMIQFSHSDIVLIRKSFLLEQASTIPHQYGTLPSRKLTWEEMNQPHPVVEAATRFIREISRKAHDEGFTCRQVEA